MVEELDAVDLRLELELEIVRDAERASAAFWKAWLWQSREMRERPSRDFCARVAEHFGISADDVGREWLSWYDLLTSWDLACVLVGRDIRISAVPYGRSHRRT